MGWKCPILSSQLSEYLESNRAPTDEDVKQTLDIRTSVGAVFAQSLDSPGVVGSTTDVHEIHDALKSTLARCAMILSPARNIPKEIWGEIFFHCLSTGGNPLHSYKEAPLLLTHVSALWRSTALLTPHIWTRLHVHIIQRPLDVFSDGRSISLLQNNLAMECDQVTKYLEHAGSLPLNITFSSQYALRSTARYPVFQTISLFSRQIQTLELDYDTPRDVRMTVFPAEELPMLETLTTRSAHLIDITNTEGILSAPSLRNLVIGDSLYDRFPIPSNWSRLVKLSINEPTDSIIARDLLTYCKCLAHCKLVLSPALGRPRCELPNIHCPQLNSLTIIDPPRGPSFDSLLRWLHPPNLRFFHWSFYSYTITTSRNEFPSRNVPSPTTNLGPAFLSRLQNLETLVVNPDNFSAEDLRRCLSLVPSVKRLLLGNIPQALADDSQFDITPVSLETNFLKLLAIHLQPPGESESTSRTEFFLPNLEILEQYGALPSDQDILDFIITRMSIDPTTTPTPSRRLREFIAWVDNRDMEMDISLKVRDHAKKLGVPFTLEIRYANVHGSGKLGYIFENILKADKHVDQLSSGI